MKQAARIIQHIHTQCALSAKLDTTRHSSRRCGAIQMRKNGSVVCVSQPFVSSEPQFQRFFATLSLASLMAVAVDWWKWSTDPDPWSDDGAVGNDRAPGNNCDFEPQHKPAQDVLAKYYIGGCPSASQQHLNA